jgi:hypothetical protein
MKLILSICLVVLGTSVSFGQDAKSQGILDKLSTKMKGLKSFYIEFSANIKNADSGQNENETGKVDILVGAFMVMKRELYLEIGGFDENCFMYSDDIDLSYMVLKTGKSNYYFHETAVIHYKGESTVRDGLYMKRFREAMHFFYKKHFQKSIFFDFFMSIGVFFFSFIKKNQAVKVSREIHEYFLISANEKLALKVENLLGKKVTLIDSTAENSLNSLTKSQNKNIEFIFDNNQLQCKSIINYLQTFKNKGFTFKILPRKSDFMIGSNSSNDRGEVIALKTDKV